MFSFGRSCSRLAAIGARAQLSSKVKKFDPRSEEVKRVIMPWNYSKDHKESRRFFQIFEPTGSTTDILKLIQTPIDLRKSKIMSWWRKKIYLKELDVQAYDVDRQAALGSDLSAGHALLPLGAGLLYKGKPWMKIELGKYKQPELPEEYEDGWILEAVDLSGCSIHYEGFRNLQNLNNVHTVIARNCLNIDVWCLDLLSSEVLGLEVLDLSGCKTISPGGLAALTRLPNLRTLDLSDCPAFATNDGVLMCLLLQDFNPKLDILGVEYPNVPCNDTSRVNSNIEGKTSPSVL